MVVGNDDGLFLHRKLPPKSPIMLHATPSPLRSMHGC
jgi:hypothetical protein